MQCDYFDAGVCRSCTSMGVPYAVQLADKDASVRSALAALVDGALWLEPFSGPESGFRNKAKLVVGGRRGAPELGILDGRGGVADLTRCGLYEPALAAAVRALPGVVARSGLTPYDVGRRSGELKNILVTASPDDELMVRFVLRSPGQLPRLREALDDLRTTLPGTTVVTANLLPEHKAVLEGPEEVVLTQADSLTMRVDGVGLHLRPQSFFQTNTTVATGLYRQVTDWVSTLRATVLWDLYCGVGGFALHALRAGAVGSVRGVEVSPAAVDSANRTAREMGAAPGIAVFETGDATQDLGPARDASTPSEPAGTTPGSPEVLVVNPPRRGIGADLAWRIERSPDLRHVVYSSCNVTTLSRDLAAMPSLRVRSARLFDMFPQSSHHEVAVLLERV
ncbi:methyltransferase domain-containing protein [Pedococcus sp. NPDC057267]|uniref:methyltransferase domain-containing protein n=1 Tax=Pedococcus sp. NPDC057267 TaxID=3346077 RepID=UPI0036415256